ncbi:hypothetical protein OXX59_009828 [Metschnikowia pulcherrima]
MAIEREHGTYVAKESHRNFVSKALECFVKEREGRGGFAIIDKDFAQEIPDIDLTAPGRYSLRKSQVKGKETFKSRLQSTMASI